MATNWKKKNDPLEGKRYWFVFFVICNIIREEHAVGLNPTGRLEIYAKGHWVPSPSPSPRTPSKDFTRFFKTVMGRNLFSPETVNNSLLLYILTSTWKFIKHTICYSAKMFLFQKTWRLVAKIGAIYFLHVTRRNLTFSNISDKALAYLF